jgi:hypothetical protein
VPTTMLSSPVREGSRNVCANRWRIQTATSLQQDCQWTPNQRKGAIRQNEYLGGWHIHCGTGLPRSQEWINVAAKKQLRELWEDCMVSTEAIVTRKYRLLLFCLSTIFLFSQTGIIYGQERRDMFPT